MTPFLDDRPQDDERPRAAAIVDDGAGDAAMLLASIAQEQRQRGRRVRGLVMTRPNPELGCAADMVLVDLETRDEYRVSQPLGAGSTSCRADPDGFARASRVLRLAVDESPDLVVSNRFGALEAGGGGFRAELLALMSQGVPLLTLVAERHRPAWDAFTGGAPVLPADRGVIGGWLDAQIGRNDDHR